MKKGSFLSLREGSRPTAQPRWKGRDGTNGTYGTYGTYTPHTPHKTHSFQAFKLWIILLVVGSAVGARAVQPSVSAGVTILLRDGKSITATSVRREGNNVMASVALNFTASSGAAPAGAAQIGYPVSSIAKIDFPEPPQIKGARENLARGKAEEALTQIEPIVAFYQPFRDVPGNWWTPSALVKLNALVSLHREGEAEAMIAHLSQTGSDPEAALAARVQLAAGWARKGDSSKALTVFDAAIKQSKTGETLAQAWVGKGNALLAGKEFADALRAFLHVPVFYPEQKLVMPGALLGSAKAYLALEDAANGKNALGDLTIHYPESPEAAIAKEELQKMEKTKSGNP